MKLLLTSSGLEGKTRDYFIDLIKEKEDQKMCFIFTVRTQDDWKWIDIYDEEFRDLPIKYDKINISEDFNIDNITDYDIYYVAGGNTYYIIDRLRKVKLDQIIKKSIDNDRIYIGVSAGSIIVGPDIDIAGLGADGDENDISLQDLDGFDRVPFIIFPHYKDSNYKEIEEYRNLKPELDIITLKDGEAIFYDGNNKKHIK